MRRHAIDVAVWVVMVVWPAMSGAQSTSATASAQAAQEQQRREAMPCGDFLAKLKRSHPKLRFDRCEKDQEAQLRVLRSIYRVPGAQAAAVEKYLMRSSGMAALRFVCCGWENALPRNPNLGRHGIYKRSNDRYEVSMSSGEILINKRSRWAAIPYFEVHVVYFIDEP
jgi:Domian of unknown function (DUF4952)